MEGIVLVTADSVRRDFVDAMPFVDGHDVLAGIAAGHYTRPSLAALVVAQALFDLTLSSLRGSKRVSTSGGLKTFEQVIRSGIHIGMLFFVGMDVSGLVPDTRQPSSWPPLLTARTSTVGHRDRRDVTSLAFWSMPAMPG